MEFTGIAQDNDSLSLQKNYRKIGLRSYGGRIIAHSKDVENTSGSRPISVEIEFSKRKKSEETWHLCNCYPTAGWIAGYTHFNNNILGDGAHLGYFVQYHLWQTSRFGPAIRGQAGISYNNRPYHPTKNPNNNSYALPINAFLQLSGVVEWVINKNWAADVNASFNHISNGGLKEPNKGINWATLGASVYFVPNFSDFYSPKKYEVKKINAQNYFFRSEMYASGYTRTFMQSREFYPITGLEFLGGYYPNNLHSFIAGVELNYNFSRQQLIAIENLNKTAFRIGLSAGHEFVMGRFRFSQKLGFYALDELNLHNFLYHKWGLMYINKKGWLAGFELKAHRHIAEYAVLKTGWHFQKP